MIILTALLLTFPAKHSSEADSKTGFVRILYPKISDACKYFMVYFRKPVWG